MFSRRIHSWTVLRPDQKPSIAVSPNRRLVRLVRTINSALCSSRTTACNNSSRRSQSARRRYRAFGQRLPTNTGYYARVTGGGIAQVGNYYYLVMGQDCEGLYSTAQGDYRQVAGKPGLYATNRRLLVYSPAQLKRRGTEGTAAGPNDQSAPYNRRDLNVVPELSASGAENIRV